MSGRGSLQCVDGPHFEGVFFEGWPLHGLWTDRRGQVFKVSYRDEMSYELDVTVFSLIQSGTGFSSKIPNRARVDNAAEGLCPHPNAEFSQHSSNLSSEPPSSSSQRRVRPVNAHQSEPVGGHRDDYDWESFKREVGACGLSGTDIAKLYQESKKYAPPGRSAGDFASDAQSQADDSMWNRFREQLRGCGLSQDELERLYLASLGSSPPSSTHKDQWSEDSSDGEGDGEGDWERFRREMSDTGLSLTELATLFCKSQQSAAMRSNTGRGVRGGYFDCEVGGDEQKRFLREMSECGLSEEELVRLYRESTSVGTDKTDAGRQRTPFLAKDEHPMAGSGMPAAAASSKPKQSDWDRFRHQMSDTGLSPAELSDLYRQSRKEAAGEGKGTALGRDAPATAPGEGKPCPGAEAPPHDHEHHDGASRRRGDPEGSGRHTHSEGSDRPTRSGCGGNQSDPEGGGRQPGHQHKPEQSSRGGRRGSSRDRSGAGHRRAAPDGTARASGRPPPHDSTTARPPGAPQQPEDASGAGGTQRPTRAEGEGPRRGLGGDGEPEAALRALGPKLIALATAGRGTAQVLLKHVYRRHPPRREGAGSEAPTDFGEAVMRKNLLRAIQAYHEDKNLAATHGLEWHILCREITKQLNGKLEAYR